LNWNYNYSINAVHFQIGTTYQINLYWQEGSSRLASGKNTFGVLSKLWDFEIGEVNTIQLTTYAKARLKRENSHCANE